MQVEALEDVADSGSDDRPCLVERSIKNTAKGLDGEMGVSARRLGERGGLVVRAVDEDGVVTVARDTIIVTLSLVLVGSIRGNSSRLARL